MPPREHIFGRTGLTAGSATSSICRTSVTESVIGAIAPAVEKAEIERAKRKPTESLDAYAVYLRGLAKLYQSIEEQARAKPASERRGIAPVQQRDRTRSGFCVRLRPCRLLLRLWPRATGGFQTQRTRLPK